MDREQALDVALGQIERNFGKGAVMKMSDQAHVSVGAISTGSLSLDLALGIGGLPRGRIVEIFGPESSGKTTLVYHVIAEAQRRGGICAFIDAEHAMDPTYAKRIGVNIDELLVSQPDTGEQALEITELLIRSGALSVVAIDSVAALTPKAEIEGEMGDSHVGLQARLMSQALRKLAGTFNRTDTICIFTNQLREKIGVMFGNPEVTPGGRALKFYSSVLKLTVLHTPGHSAGHISLLWAHAGGVLVVGDAAANHGALMPAPVAEDHALNEASLRRLAGVTSRLPYSGTATRS